MWWLIDDGIEKIAQVEMVYWGKYAGNMILVIVMIQVAMKGREDMEMWWWMVVDGGGFSPCSLDIKLKLCVRF